MMGTKNNPGMFDCYDAAEPDEPMFVLLARDRMAPQLVRDWADARADAGEDRAKVQEAYDCADAMDAWRREHRPAPIGPVTRCLAHMQPEPCPTCAAYIAAGL